MAQGKNTIFVVVGMHRSGTSLLTRGLGALGIELGDNLLKESQAENPKGHWEDIDILRLSDEVLARLGRRWQSVQTFLDEDFAGHDIEPLVDEAEAIVSSKMGSLRNWGFKNPRTGPLLPFWQKVFDRLGVNVKYVVAVRNPLNVGLSLQRRNKFAAGYGQAMWLSQNLDTLRNILGKPTIFVSYDALVTNTTDELRRVADGLDLPWDDSVAQSVRDYAKSFEDLIHFKKCLADLKADSLSFPEAIALYELLISQCTGNNTSWNEKLIEDIGRITNEWQNRTQMIQMMEEHEANVEVRLSEFETRIQRQIKEIQDFREEIENKSCEIECLKAEIERQSCDIEYLKGMVTLHQNELHILEGITEGYQSTVTEILSSSRWRTGNAIGIAKQRLLLRPGSPTVNDAVACLTAQFQEFKARK